MDYGCMYSALETIRAARLFYEYGKMGRLLECGASTLMSFVAEAKM